MCVEAKVKSFLIFSIVELLLLSVTGRKTTTTTASIDFIDASHRHHFELLQQQQQQQSEEQEEQLVGCSSEAAATALNESVVDGGSYGPACCPGKSKYFLFFRGDFNCGEGKTAGGFHPQK